MDTDGSLSSLVVLHFLQHSVSLRRNNVSKISRELPVIKAPFHTHSTEGRPNECNKSSAPTVRVDATTTTSE